VASGFTFVSWW